jgi:uncharacterized Ntn-hydrolase superfamily protein
MVAELVPGEGAVAAQYDTSLRGKRAIADALAAGDDPETALAGVIDPAFDDRMALRQYGVVGFAGTAAGFTGDEVEGAAAWVGDETVSVQGNTLRGPEVVDEAYRAFLGAEGSLGDRLLAGLEAGREAGGDARCDVDQPEKSAFLFVADGDGEETKIRASGAFRGADPVDRVREEWEGTAGCDVTGGAGSLAAVVVVAGLVRRGRRAGRV